MSESTQPIPSPRQGTRDACCCKLGYLAEQWRLLGEEPPAAKTLSRTEFRALCVATGKTQFLVNPIIEFLELPDELREWALDVLHQEWKRNSHARHLANGPRDVDIWFRERNARRLDVIASDWRTRSKEPEVLESLSSGEFVAVSLAAGRPQNLLNPVRSFLDLDGYLQKWVLCQLELPGHVGQVIGHASL